MSAGATVFGEARPGEVPRNEEYGGTQRLRYGQEWSAVFRRQPVWYRDFKSSLDLGSGDGLLALLA